MSKSQLLAFEEKADGLASNLLVLKQSVPDLLGRLFYSIDHLVDSGMVREAGDLCSRLSYLPCLLEKSIEKSSEEIDLTQLFVDWQNLLQYLHFNELMPQVHKDYFDINGSEPKGFYLCYKDDRLSEYEIKDILLADLSRPFCREKPNQIMGALLVIIASDPRLVKFPTHLIEELMGFYEENLFDLFEIPDSVYIEIADCTAQEFRSLRNYLFAFSEFLQNMTTCAKAWNPPMSREKEKERMIQGSIFCFLPKNNLFDQIKKYTSLDENKVMKLLQPFTLDLRPSISKAKSKNEHSRDGYFPPIIKIDDGYCVPPMAVKSFFCNRNLLFAFQRKNLHKFNSVISGSFEPSLISSIKKDLSIFDDLEIRLNHTWKNLSLKGEIDIVIYTRKLNKVLVIQVKAVIPPQGATSVRNVQSRILEGIEQIDRFKKLSTDEKERIISDSLGFQVSDLEFIDVILSSSCFGSGAWPKLEGQNICGVNSLLFKLLAYEATQAKDSSLIFSIDSWTKETIEQLMHESNLQWEEKEFRLFGTTIRFPSWSIDEKPLNVIRSQILEAVTA